MFAGNSDCMDILSRTLLELLKYPGVSNIIDHIVDGELESPQYVVTKTGKVIRIQKLP